MKVAVYTRVSTKHEEQLSSMKNQKEHYTEYCSDNGYELYNIYADEGLSATSPKRKEYLKMLEDAGLDYTRGLDGEITFSVSKERKPKFEMIITKDVSRFARNEIAIGLVHKLKEKGVYILFENAGFSTKDNDWELRLSLLLTFSAQESRDRSKKVAFAYKQRAKKGVFHMPIILYGYDYDENNGQYIINENEALVVQEIFNLYVNKGYGLKSIAAKLNSRNITTKQGYKWRGTTVKRLIQNEKYRGKVVLNRYTTTGITSSNKKIKRKSDEWIEHDDAIPSIIDADVWYKAQDILKSRVKEMKDGSKVGSNTKIKNVFHQKIKCSKCGSDFVRVSGTKKRYGKRVTEYTYYCRNRRMFGASECDMRGVSHNVLEREINKLINGQLATLTLNKLEFEKGLTEQLLYDLDEKRASAEEDAQKIQCEIDSITDKIDKIFANFLDGDIGEGTKQAANRQIDSLETQRKELESDIQKYTTKELDKLEDKILDQFALIEFLSQKNQYTFDEFLKLIDNIKVYPEKTLEFWFSIPTMLLFIVEEDKDRIEEIQTMQHIYKVKY